MKAASLGLAVTLALLQSALARPLCAEEATDSGVALAEPLSVTPPRAQLHTTDELLQQIRRYSFGVRSARARELRAKANVRRARSQLLPSVEAVADINRNLVVREIPGIDASGGSARPVSQTLPNPSTSWDLALTLRAPLLAPRAWYEWGQATRGVEAAAEGSHDADRVALGSALDATLGVLAAERLSDVSRVSFRAALATLALTREQLRQGLGTRVDVVRALQEVTDARAQMLSVDERLQHAFEVLALTLGQAEPVGVAKELAATDLARVIERSCHSLSDASRRPDVAAARHEAELAHARLAAVDLAYLPTINATSELKYWSSRLLSPNQLPVTWSVGAELSVPLFDGDARASEKSRLLADAELLDEQLGESRRQATVDGARARRAALVATESAAVAQETRDLALETLSLLKERFRIGEVTSFELVAQTRRVRETEADFAVKSLELTRAELAAQLANATCAL